MGIILNKDAPEIEIMSAYGLTVYGKINTYIWEIYGGIRENALISIRIIDDTGKDIFSMNMGNRFIFQQRIDDTLDNFLYWITMEHPDAYSIEKQVYRSLCQSDCFFNCIIEQSKELYTDSKGKEMIFH